MKGHRGVLSTLLLLAVCVGYPVSAELMRTDEVPYFHPCLLVDYVHAPELWMRHPVLGAPSFRQTRLIGTAPIYRGSEPYAWPVNVSGFVDPVSGDWFAYVGRYLKDYKLTPELSTHCVVLRSRDKGATWQDLGRILPPDPPHVYAGETSPIGHAPDTMVIYADGRYHACFDWTTANTTWENAANPGPDANSGAGYAWAEHPEGPWHVTERPIVTTRDMKPLYGKYRRVYASSIVRRKNDWLVLSDVDSGPYFGWGVVGMTAEHPEGPYSEPKLLLSCESDTYYPPLLEFFPAKVVVDRIVMPATSVAKNRAPQFEFSVAVEDAMDPAAWKMDAGDAFAISGHNQDLYSGLWGQATALLTRATRKTENPRLYADEDTDLVLFPSRDAQGFGTIHLAQAAETSRDKMVLTVGASDGPALILSTAGHFPSVICAQLQVTGTVSVIWGVFNALGPDIPRSDASFDASALYGSRELKMTEQGSWEILQHGSSTDSTILASGLNTDSDRSLWTIQLGDPLKVGASLLVDGKPATDIAWEDQGCVGFHVAPHSSAVVSSFIIGGAADDLGNPVKWSAKEGLLGAAQNLEDWEERDVVGGTLLDRRGYVAKEGRDVRVKWNFHGVSFILHLPAGPDLGVAEILLDGRKLGEVNQKTDGPPMPWDEVKFFGPRDLPFGPHAIVVRPVSGRIAIGYIEANVPGPHTPAGENSFQTAP